MSARPADPVLVTGASGFLAGHLIEQLLARGCRVIAASRRPSAVAGRPRAGLELRRLDLLDAESRAAALRGARTLVHLAALREAPGGDPAEMERLNVDATEALARQAAAAGLHHVFVGTARVFGPSQGAPRDEESPLAVDGGAGFYAATRARATERLRALAAAGAALAIVHPTVIFGLDRPQRRNRLTTELRRRLRRRLLLAPGGGRARRDLVHVDDVVAALIAAADPAAAGVEAIVGGEALGLRELAHEARRAAGLAPPAVVAVPWAAVRSAAVLVDRLRRYDRRVSWQASVRTLEREWRIASRRAAAQLDHRPPPLRLRLEQTVAALQRQEGDRS